MPSVRSAVSTIQVHNLRKVFPNGHEALKDLSFSIAPGTLVSIIGRSGAGKSTLLRCLNGILTATSGTIRINDIEVTAASPQERRELRRRIGFVYQEYNLVDRSTAFRNVLAGRLGQMPGLQSVLGVFPQADRMIALSCLDRVQLLHKAGQRADRLSGGEKQRVAIARALAQQPWLILADEPVASLDPELAHEVMRFLRAAATDTGLPVLVNIHDVALAQEYSDRIIGIAEGLVAFDGPPAELTRDVLRRVYRRDPRTLVGAEHMTPQSALALGGSLGDVAN
ncbi:MAG: phosphonate ABC transporter ATP-binding protein [Chloroflexales bacterium]|nr:phosphonate ABC transporter ATP-binding protein [Chloroflexales bacterium]